MGARDLKQACLRTPAAPSLGCTGLGTVGRGVARPQMVLFLMSEAPPLPLPSPSHANQSILPLFLKMSLLLQMVKTGGVGQGRFPA